MNLRKLFQLNTTLGLTIPRLFAEALGFKKGDYAEVFLRDDQTIVIKPHKNKGKKITIHDK